MVKIDSVFKKDSKSVYVISEIGVNHNGSLEEALKLIDASAEAKVDAVKFQKRNLEKIYSKEILDDPNSAEWTFDYLIPLLKEMELSEDDYRVIKKKCNDLNVDLIVTPFDEDSAEFVAELGISAFKIASADMVNFPLIEKCASYDHPLIISTGMWDEETIRQCVDHYNSKNIKFVLLLANSTYPSPYESLNLSFYNTLKEIHPYYGYSGHERGIFIPVAAAAMGARIVEKHITFDRHSEGPDHKASMYPEEFSKMVQDLRSLELAMGERKDVNQAETLAKEAFAKSAVAIVDLEEGHVLKPEDIELRCPGKGIFPHEIKDYFGKTLKRKVIKGRYIAKDDFEDELLIKDWSVPKFKKDWGVKCRFHDFDEYSALKSPVIEFHCSDTDLNVEFQGGSKHSQLVVHAPEIVDRKLVDICSDDPVVVEYSIDILQKTIDKTLQIAKNFPKAKPKIVMHLGGMSLDHVMAERPNEMMIERAIDHFKKLSYNNSDVDILPENLPPRPWYLGGQWFQYGFMPSGDMKRFCEHFGLGMTFDLCHAGLYCNHSGISLTDYTKDIKHLISHMHISDAAGIDGEGVQIGDGNVDFDNVLKEMKDHQCSWVTEIWSGHLHNGAGTYKSLHSLSKFSGIL